MGDAGPKGRPIDFERFERQIERLTVLMERVLRLRGGATIRIAPKKNVRKPARKSARRKKK